MRCSNCLFAERVYVLSFYLQVFEKFLPRTPFRTGYRVSYKLPPILLRSLLFRGLICKMSRMTVEFFFGNLNRLIGEITL